MFDTVDVWLINFILIILILLIHTLIEIYLIRRIRDLEMTVKFNDKILEAVVHKTGLSVKDIMIGYEGGKENDGKE